MEIGLNAVSVETVGDVMTLLYLLKEKLGMDFTYANTQLLTDKFLLDLTKEELCNISTSL